MQSGMLQVVSPCAPLTLLPIVAKLPRPLYATEFGAAYLGDALELLQNMPAESVDLVLTSPPFALLRQKAYGNVDQEAYVDWMYKFAVEIWRVLKPSGSFVIELGGAYQKGRPVRSLYQYRLLIRLCDDLGWRLAQEFFWFNPARLPSPIQWVNKLKIRAKDAVNIIWWLSKTDFPKADISRVLTPYSSRTRQMLQNAAKHYKPKLRPSGHNISDRFAKDRGGAIPPNLLQLPNTESNSAYLRWCTRLGVPAHPARFPEQLPAFFVRFLTDPNDVVLDIFAGSNTTGAVAETLGRRWLAFEINRQYLAASIFRFLSKTDESSIIALYNDLSGCENKPTHATNPS